MNKQNYSGCAMQPYTAPTCEMHEMVPEGMLCQSESGYRKGGPGNYGDGFTNDLDGWFY